jgi:hypothetical protein
MAAREAMPGQVGERADRVVRRIRAVAGNVLLFSAGTSFESWPRRGFGSGQDQLAGILFSARRALARSVMSTIFQPVIQLWNDDHHVAS